ncbi:MAG: aspartyl protease family protein [Cyclobacteriaceae bacterium]
MSATIITNLLPYRWLLAIGLLCLTYEQAPASDNYGLFEFQDGKKQVEIPFHTFNNQIILRVKVNRKIPLNFMLDTGSRQAILFDLKLAKDLEIDMGRQIAFSGVGNERMVSAFRTTGVTLGLPGIEGKRMGMVVLNQDYLSMKDYDIQGIIGYQLFYRFAIKIDYENRILTISDPGIFKPDKAATAFDLDVDSAKPVLQAKAGFDEEVFHSCNLLIDTGASYSMSLFLGSSPAFDKRKIKGGIRSIGKGLGGTVNGKVHQVLLQLNQIGYSLPTICLTPRSYSKRGKITDGINGAIGGEFLSNFVVTFNYSKGKLYLEPQFEQPLVIQGAY